MASESLPILAVIDLDNDDSDKGNADLVNRLFPEQEIDSNSVWTIDTKYYEAKVQIKILNKGNLITTHLVKKQF